MKKRARDLGLDLPGTPGTHNAITDVAGVEVGYSTIIHGEPEDWRGPGSHFARTGVTAILPRGHRRSIVFAGRHDLNGNGELTGTHWIDDSGFLHGPVMITNTNSVGIVRDTVSRWMIEHNYYAPLVYDGREIPGLGFFYPVVGETWDGKLNDISGFHVKPEHALEALESTTSGLIAEGSVGGGTGMMCHDFKGGTGTASRVLSPEEGGYTVGVLLQANHGSLEEFQVLGVPMGKLLTGYAPVYAHLSPEPGTGSVIAIIATDAPVLPWQLSKLCKRVPMGLGRLGAYGTNGSGDIFLAFSTANEQAYCLDVAQVDLLSDQKINPLYRAVVECVEEAVLNALCAAETMVGRQGNTAYALPHDLLVAELARHGRIRA